MEDNIYSCALLLTHECKLQTAWGTDSRAGHIQLPMGEDLASEPNSSKLQRLTLGLVDGHGESRSYWKLAPLPLKRILTWLGNESNPWNENISARLNNSTLEELFVNTLVKNQTGSITQSLAWVDVAEEHKRHS